jgi:hypothetical protein
LKRPSKLQTTIDFEKTESKQPMMNNRNNLFYWRMF